MATFEERQKQYNEVDVPAARMKYVADGIRKKFGSEFDLSGLSDQDVINRHHARFGADMTDADYNKKVEETYAKGFEAPSAPTQTLSDKAAALGEGVKQTAEGLVPFAVPEAGNVALGALKAAPGFAAKRIPVASQVGFAAGHAANIAVDVGTANALKQTAADLPVPNTEDRTWQYYDQLRPGLSARGWSNDQIMQEARQRAQAVTRGYQQTVASIDEDVQGAQQAALTEPARGAADAFFMGVGAPMIEGVLNKSIAKLGIGAVPAAEKAASTVAGRVIKHTAIGAGVGGMGIGIQGAINAALQSAADNKTPAEIGHALTEGGVSGFKVGAAGGALLGGGFSALAEAGGAAARPLVERVKARAQREAAAQAEVDAARLRGWQEARAQREAEQVRVGARDQAIANREHDKRVAAIERTGETFDPHQVTIPYGVDPAEVATTIVQQQHGEDGALSEAGLRAASKIEQRIRLYQDANDHIAHFQNVELPLREKSAETSNLAEPVPAPEAPREQPLLTQPLGVVEAPQEEIHPMAEVGLQRATPKDFLSAVTRAAEQHSQASGSLAVHPAEYYSRPGVELYLSGDSKTGYALVPRPEGGKELVSLFNTGKKGMGLAAAQEAVTKGATHLDALQGLEKLYKRAGFRTTRVEPNWVQGEPNVVYMEQKRPAARSPGTEAKPGMGEASSAPVAQEPRPVAIPTAAERAISQIEVGKHASLLPGEQGQAIHLERLGVPAGEVSTPGASAEALANVVKAADKHQLPITTRITQAAGPRGGIIPLEKLIPWYEKHGFKVVKEGPRLPEGQLASADLRREPRPIPAKRMTVLEGQRAMMERALQKPETASEQELAAPAREPGPGRWHEINLRLDANIASARERIKAREADFPPEERDRSRQAGFVGDKAGHRDPTSYDWADFADRVQVGVNMLLKHGLNKAEWVERMVGELGDKFRAIADRVYQESVAAYNARRPTGNDEVRQVVDDYVHQVGLGRGATRHDVYPALDPKFSQRVGEAYDALRTVSPGTPEWKAAEQSYAALNHEVAAQYDAMVRAGYKVEHTTDDPYPTSTDMRADVAQNKRIRAFKTPSDQQHPFMTPEQNDKFRAVHDFFGHAAEGYEFGPRGEDAAFRKHASTLSNMAVPALATGTRGQNSWVNFMPENAKLPPKERPFAEQKAALLPKWAYDDVLRERAERAPKSGLTVGLAPRGERVEGRQVAVAAEKLAKGVRPVTNPEAVRARFISDGQDAVTEMMATSPESANWYHDDIERMHKLTEQELPSIKKPGHRALFDLLLGFTSPNTNVPQNYARAFDLMRDFEQSGKVPFLRRHGQEVNIGSRKWVPKLNSLIGRFGGDLDAMRAWLLSRDEKTGKYNVTKEFGPKVGPFTLNIQGIHDQVTVDSWMVRRLRRLSGTLYQGSGAERKLNENWGPLAQEQRDIEAGIQELSKSTGLDPDAIQAILWDNEKMVWERAGLVAPRIPFSVAAEGVLRNMKKASAGIEKAHAQETML